MLSDTGVRTCEENAASRGVLPLDRERELGNRERLGGHQRVETEEFALEELRSGPVILQDSVI